MSGIDVQEDKKSILDKLKGLQSLLDIDEQKQERRANLEKWRQSYDNIKWGADNPIAFLLLLVKQIKSKKKKKQKGKKAEEANFQKQKKKAKSGTTSEWKSQIKRAKEKYINYSNENQYAALLSSIVKQSVAKVLPRTKEIVFEEIIKAFNCDLSMNIPVVGDGLIGDIVIEVPQIDLFKQLLYEPDVGVGKFTYEPQPFNDGAYQIAPPTQYPFPMNRFLWEIINNSTGNFPTYDVNPVTNQYPVYGKSGLVLFFIGFDATPGFEKFIISPAYKDPAVNSTLFNDANPSSVGAFQKFTIIEWLKDYFDNMEIVHLNNLLGSMLEILAGGVTFGGGKHNFADILGINKLIGFLNNLMAQCDGGTLDEISTDSISHLSELFDDDSYFEFSIPQNEELYKETERKLKGVIKLESCDNVEIPLDMEFFENGCDEIIASLVEGGTGYKQFDLLLQNGVQASVVKNTPWLKEQDWSWNVAFLEELIKNFPQIFMISIMSSKTILPIVTIAKMLNQNALLASNPAEFAKIFKRVVIRIFREIMNEVIKIIFKLVLQYIQRLIIAFIKSKLKERGAKYFRVIMSLINNLLPLLNELLNAKNCKEIFATLLKILDATGLDIPFSPPQFLLFGAEAKPGRSSLKTFQNLIEKLDALGLPTGDAPDGTPNLMLLSQFEVIDAININMDEDGKVNIMTYPNVAVGPIGAMVVNPGPGVGGSF